MKKPHLFHLLHCGVQFALEISIKGKTLVMKEVKFVSMQRPIRTSGILSIQIPWPFAKAHTRYPLTKYWRVGDYLNSWYAMWRFILPSHPSSLSVAFLVDYIPRSPSKETHFSCLQLSLPLCLSNIYWFITISKYGQVYGSKCRLAPQWSRCPNVVGCYPLMQTSLLQI